MYVKKSLAHDDCFRLLFRSGPSSYIALVCVPPSRHIQLYIWYPRVMDRFLSVCSIPHCWGNDPQDTYELRGYRVGGK